MNACAACKAEINPGATRCHHCGSPQGDLANPLSTRFLFRFWLPLIAVSILLAIPIVYLKSGFREYLRGTSIRPEAPAFHVLATELLRVTQGDRSYVGALGEIKNPTPTAWDVTRLEITFFDRAGNRIDVLTDRPFGLVLTPKSNTPFRVLDIPARKLDEYASCQVRVSWATPAR